jgi:hypothetical protein
MGANMSDGLDRLIEELKSNGELFARLSTDPAGTVNELDYLNENEKALVGVVSPKDLVSIDMHRAGDEVACALSCGMSCGGSCGGTCGASCGASCGGSCAASCGGSCGASCGASCGGSCGVSGILSPTADMLAAPEAEMDSAELIGVIKQQIAEFKPFARRPLDLPDSTN